MDNGNGGIIVTVIIIILLIVGAYFLFSGPSIPSGTASTTGGYGTTTSGAPFVPATSTTGY